MANEHDAVIAAPDYVTADFYDVVLSGGHWTEANPLTNLADELLSQVAQSASAGASACVVDVDLGTLRSIKFVGIPDSNVSRQGRVKLVISDTPSFAGITLGAVANADASVITVRSGGATTIHVGDVFSIADDRDSNGKLRTYRFTQGATLATNISSTLGISGDLASTIASGGALTCHSGDFSTAVVSSVYNGDFEDWWPIVYDLGSLSWPLKSWDGKLPDEEAMDFPKQWFTVLDPSVLGRYMRLRIEDTSNEDGYVELPRLFVAGGWFGGVYIDIGASLGWETTTTLRRSKANAKFYNKGVQYRRFVFRVPNVEVDEALQQAADMVKRVGVHRQVYMVIDKDDALNRHRVCFIGHLARLDPQEFVNFDANSVPFAIEEDSEGEA